MESVGQEREGAREPSPEQLREREDHGQTEDPDEPIMSRGRTGSETVPMVVFLSRLGQGDSAASGSVSRGWIAVFIREKISSRMLRDVAKLSRTQDS